MSYQIKYILGYGASESKIELFQWGISCCTNQISVKPKNSETIFFENIFLNFGLTEKGGSCSLEENWLIFFVICFVFGFEPIYQDALGGGIGTLMEIGVSI